MFTVLLTSQAGDQGSGQGGSELCIFPSPAHPWGERTAQRFFKCHRSVAANVGKYFFSLQSWSIGKNLGWPLGGWDGSGGNIILGLSDPVQDTLLNESSSP